MAANPKLSAHRPPPVPPHLSAEGAELWRWYQSRIELFGAEGTLLSALIEQLDQYSEFMDQVREEGPVVTNPTTGATRQNPALSAAHACLRAARQTLKHLDLPDPEAEFQPRGSRSRGRR